MEHLIDSLLNYAQAGQAQLNRQRVKVDQIIEGVRITLAFLDQKEACPDCVRRPLPTVDADPLLPELVFQNLVSNARSSITAPVKRL